MRSKRGTTVRNRSLILCAAILTVLGISVVAQAGVPPPTSIENDYEGHAAGGDPATYVGFDLAKKHGVKTVTKFGAFLTYRCDSGPGGTVFGRAKGSLRVGDNGKFQGTKSVQPVFPAPRGGAEFQDFKYVITGKLGKHGKAEGTIEASLKVPPLRPRGTLSKCTTKPRKLDWNAKKGANSVPQDPNPN
jgi:hypothetical protein